MRIKNLTGSQEEILDVSAFIKVLHLFKLNDGADSLFLLIQSDGLACEDVDDFDCTTVLLDFFQEANRENQGLIEDIW